MPWSRAILAAVIAAIGCLIGDHLHVVRGVLVYTHPCCWQQAWWVFPLFFGATFAMFGLAKLLLPARPAEPPSVRMAAGDFLGFMTAYAFTAFANSLPTVVLGVLLTFWLARVISGVPKGVVLLSLVCGLSGTLFEMCWAGLGMFTYLHPDFFNVALWLPSLYMHAALAGASSWRVVDAK